MMQRHIDEIIAIKRLDHTWTVQLQFQSEIFQKRREIQRKCIKEFYEENFSL